MVVIVAAVAPVVKFWPRPLHAKLSTITTVEHDELVFLTVS